MKKVVYFLLALVVVGLGACDNGPKFKVQGEVTGAEDKTLIWKPRDWKASNCWIQ